MIKHTALLVDAIQRKNKLKNHSKIVFQNDILKPNKLIMIINCIWAQFFEKPN